MKRPAISIYRGRTTHVRYKPFERRFQYGVFLIDLDIDRLGEAEQSSFLFSINRPGLFSFHETEHGARERGALKPWALDLFSDAKVDLNGGAIRLCTFPRHLFFKFAPLSLWFGYGPTGELRGVIYEVANTFGERHCYVAGCENTNKHLHTADKHFHVSPFFDVSGRYQFTLRTPGDKLDVVVASHDHGERLHMANIKARALPATTSAFARLALSMPASSLGVTLGIHWEALQIWLKGARYRPRPTLPPRDATLASIDQYRTQSNP
ncbi:MAG: DUF1365 domain-containing protein [Pseudomonadota bacterium]